MTRILKTSGFLGLATMMSVGLYQETLLMQNQVVPPWLVAGHAHLGVLSILAVVVGFAVDFLGIAGTLRRAVTGLFLAGQWLLPLTIWVGIGFEQTYLMPGGFLWGLCLVVSMLLLAYHTATADSTVQERPRVAPADD